MLVAVVPPASFEPALLATSDADGRFDLINGTLGSDYAGGIPVFFATYDRGAEWAVIAGLELHMIADVFRGEATTTNVLAESGKSKKSNKSKKSDKSKKSKKSKK